MPGEKGGAAQRRIGLPQGHGSGCPHHPRGYRGHSPAGVGEDPEWVERSGTGPGFDRAPDAGSRGQSLYSARPYPHPDVFRKGKLVRDRQRSGGSRHSGDRQRRPGNRGRHRADERAHRMCRGYGRPGSIRQSLALPRWTSLAGRTGRSTTAVRSGAICRGTRACPVGHPPPGRHSAHRDGVPQAPGLVHPRPARVQRPQTAPLPDRIDRGSRGDLPRISRACRSGGVTAEQIEALLAEVAAGRIAPHAALEKLRHLPFEDLSFARIDHHRELRQGQPEVVFCEGKTPDQIVAICERLEAASGSFLGTRASETVAQRLRSRFPRLIWNPTARIVHLPAAQPPRPTATGPILVISAGTSDLPVAEEAAVVAEAYGHSVERLVDVGVAGLHRLLAAGDQLYRAQVVIVVAGMEGALPSVVGGMLRVPVIAVPTSVGYGASFGGLAALLGMLNSCAAGVTVVNIDNGFGAAAAASRILRS